MQSRHISIVINRRADTVYDYASKPENLSSWASGLARSDVLSEGARLTADSPMGPVVITFAPPNQFGVLDHDVTLPTGEIVTNPLRVIPHPEGAEVVFTIRQRGMSDEEFDRDARTIGEDLATLKALVESYQPAGVPRP